MKILFVEDSLDGHHVPYLRGLTNGRKYESVVITPHLNEEIKVKQIVYDKIKFPTKSFIEYLRWIRFITCETINGNYDVVHFLDGDTIMRFLGIGMGELKCPKIVITYHHFFKGRMRALSYNLMCMDRVAVVHTKSIKEHLNAIGVKCVKQVEYPSFSFECENFSSQFNSVPILGALGGTRWDKGLDLLLRALEKVKKPYKLLVAGAPIGITEKDLENAKTKLNREIEYDLRFLSNSEFTMYLNMVDIFVLPYRRIFDGASGPLTEGVARGKMIIGADHGSLGETIRDNHLGITFETENVDDLAKAIDRALSEKFEYDEIAKKYQKILTTEGFQDAYYKIYLN